MMGLLLLLGNAGGIWILGILQSLRSCIPSQHKYNIKSQDKICALTGHTYVLYLGNVVPCYRTAREKRPKGPQDLKLQIYHL
jgi:hypothetical protein